MEKRNFVTSLRTSGESSGVDSLVEGAAAMFGGTSGVKSASAKAESEYAKRASIEDEKTDSLS
jgi:hypothetical protein